MCDGSDIKQHVIKHELEQQFVGFVLWLLLVVETARMRGSVKETREAIMDPRDPLGRARFPNCLFASFSCKIGIVNKQGPRNGLRSGLFGEQLSERERKMNSAFRLHRG